MVAMMPLSQSLMGSLTSLLSSTFIGGSDDDYALAICLDQSGNAFIAGRTGSPDYPTTQGAYDTSYNGSYDAFVSKLNGSLGSLLSSTFIGGSNGDKAYGICLDQSGDVFVAGYTYSSNFPTTTNAYDTSHNGSCDAFVSKLDNSLTSLLSSTFIGGSSWDYANAICLDQSGNLFIAGYTDSSNYPTTIGAYDTSYNGGYYDVFVSKLDNSLTSLLSSTFIGGSDYDDALAISLGTSGDLFVAGYTSSPDYPTTIGAYDTSYSDNGDVFVSKLDNSLSGTPGISLTKSGPSEAQTHSTITYTLSYKNTGTTELTDLLLQDLLPNGSMATWT
ncbi:MAG: SBBP repeat-containing protein, partial [Candidatus Desantisbacteria bacterium]